MSRQLHKWFLMAAAALLFLLSGGEAWASHAMGADLTYQCLGGNTYRIRLSFYRDCIGINAPANVFVNIRSASCGQNLGVTCNPIPGTGRQVTYLCPTATSTCNGGTFTGIQEWIYEGVVTLPMQCPDWQFSYNLCCRNAAITTISNPGSNTFFIYANLNNTITPCNSSPTFSNKPVPFACLGQQLCFNHGAVDADGDSLVYTLVNPRQTATNDVSYINPYNAVNPLASSPALQFNNATGDICFTPTQLQVTVMAVLVREFRNGVQIGSVVRDIQITVLNCTNDLPTLSGINGTNDYDMTVCANQNFCFNIYSNDANAGQNLTVTSNNGIPGGTFSAAGSPHPTGTFCWTPATADISNNPYCFTVRVNDDACPYFGANTYSYCITVKGINVNAGPDQYIACSDIATISATATGGNAPYTYLWSNGFAGATQTVPVGTYVVTVSDGSCTGTDTVQVLSAFQPAAAFTWTGACANGSVQFSDQSTSSGSLQSWTWNFGDGTGSNLQNPAHVFPGPGTYNVSLIVENIYGCTDTIVQQVVVQAPPVAAFTVNTACAGSVINLTNTSVPGGASWDWSFSNGASSSAQHPSVVLGNAGTYTGTLIVTDSSGCKDTVTQNIVVQPQPIAGFTISAANGCQNTPVTFTSTAVGGATYSWNFGDGNTSNAQNPVHIYSNNGTYTVMLIVTNASGCSDSLIQPIQVNALPLVTAGPDITICRGSNAVMTASGGTSYAWSPGGFTGSTISVSPAANTTYTVISTDANGCTAVDTVLVRVNSLPVPTVSQNVVLCQGQSATLIAGGGVFYSWNPSGNTNDTITVVPNASTTYAVNVIDANGCQATAFVNITVNPNPVVSLPAGVFICSGVSTILNPGTGGVSYLWSNGATTPTIAVSSQGLYAVTVTNAKGCTATASTQVTVGGQVISNNSTTAICQGQTATLDAGYSGFSYLWSNGATTQNISVSAAGVYAVTITDASGCTGTIANTVQVNPNPQAAFTPQDECLNDTVFFNDASFVNGGSITAWSWDLGDGNISYAQNPTHVYNTPGSYVIQLTVTSADGCSATLDDTLNIYPIPVAAFTANSGCVYSNIAFTSQSTVGFGNITNWNWTFGNGQTSSLQNPQTAFATAGNYNVTLVVSTPGGCADTISSLLRIYPQPNLSFTTSPTTICQGGSVAITNSSTSTNGLINSFQWNFGNGQTSSLNNPTVFYAAAGTYNVTLIGTTVHGCSDTLQRTVTVNALPAADAGSNQSICIGQSATLTATGGNTYVWTPGGSTSPAITVSPAASGWYSAVVTNTNGCTARDSVYVTVRPLPLVNAGVDRSLCLGGSVTLSGTGAGTYNWNPGGATTSSVLVAPGATTNYVLTLTAPNGCVNRDTVRVTVNPLPVASAGPDKTICFGTTTGLTASGGTGYLWQHNGATAATIYVNPTVPTSYIVTVTNGFGCSRNDTVVVNINSTPVVAGGNAFFCTGYSTILNAGNPGMLYEWSPGGDSTQTLVVNAPGQYTVVVTNAFGCQGAGTFNVNEGGTGLAPNPINIIACAGTSVLLDAGNPGMAYLWSTGATSQTISATTTGVYAVTVTDPGGCTAAFTNNITMQPVPVAAFTTAPACVDAPVIINNSSSVSSGNIISWAWDLGNGMLSNQSTPAMSYSTAGTFPITLIVESGFGCKDTITGTIQINPLPSADFTAQDVCDGSAVQFTDGSTVASGTITGWQWNFGDGNTAAAQLPQHAYNGAGSYLVTLVSTTGAGCNDTVNRMVTVHPKPVADFSANDVCEGDSMQFTDLSLISNGFISDVSWDFGDGTTSTIANPVHYYSAPGTYNVTMRVASDQACEAMIMKPVKVNPKPVADFSAPSVCHGGASAFADLSSISSGAVTGWYWEFGDGGFSSNPSPGYTYANAGTYTITMMVLSDLGCSDTASRQNTVEPLPVVGFSANDACFGTAVVFSDTSSVNPGTITGRQWSFGDGNGSSVQVPSHTYAATGSYTVQLTATTASGCSATFTKSVNVFPVPVANFTANDVCLNSVTTFVDQSQIAGGGTFSFSWNFGDNNSDTADVPQHLYAAYGSYMVNLMVTSQQGCSAAVSKPVTVFPLPVPSFTAGNVCLNYPVQINDNSTIVQGAITGWSWSLGDATISAAQNPTHFYQTAGVYPVTLTVMSEMGCSASRADSVEIYAPPTPAPAAGSGCVNDNIAFADTSTGSNNNIVTYDWTFGNGDVSTAASPSSVYGAAGTFTITLTTTNAQGCRSSKSVPVVVSPLPVAGFTSNPPCLNAPAQFNSTSSIPSGSITGYAWDFGDNSGTASQQNPQHTYTQPGSFDVTLVVYSGDGCTDTVRQTVVVNPLPAPAFTALNTLGCGPLPVQFSDSSFISAGNIVSWAWDFGDGGTSSQQDPLYVYNTSGSYPVTLTTTSDSGCVNTLTINNTVTVYPGPMAEFEPDPAETDILDPNFNFINLSNGALTYYWTFGDGGNSIAFEPQHAYSDTGNYLVTLYVSNAYGCRDTVQHPVRVNPIFSWWIPNAFTPNGDGSNEAFNVKGEYIVNVELTIFNRWGEKIFFSEGRENAEWDGSIMGSAIKAQEGVYVYTVRVEDVWGKYHEKIGHVSLVR